jgi:hypothetical protein
MQDWSVARSHGHKEVSMHLFRIAGAALLVVLVVLAGAPLAAGHHSFFAQFDSSQPITLEGTVTRVEWRNPHIWVFLDVTGSDGTVTSWQCEGGAPNALTRQGWTRDTLAVGGTLEIFGYRALNGSNVCNARTWTYEGRTVLAGQANDGGPNPEVPR